MILNAVIDDQIYELNVPDQLLAEARDFFDQMDNDMSQGILMSREWVESPNPVQRCQVVANKLLTALENENHNLGRLMAGYILARMPSIDSVQIDTSGEVSATMFDYKKDTAGTAEITDASALAQADRDISKIFKAGKQWKFSSYDAASGQWQDSPAFSEESDAENARSQAMQQRYHQLARP